MRLLPQQGSVDFVIRCRWLTLLSSLETLSLGYLPRQTQTHMATHADPHLIPMNVSEVSSPSPASGSPPGTSYSQQVHNQQQQQPQQQHHGQPITPAHSPLPTPTTKPFVPHNFNLLSSPTLPAVDLAQQYPFGHPVKGSKEKGWKDEWFKLVIEKVGLKMGCCSICSWSCSCCWCCCCCYWCQN